MNLVEQTRRPIKTIDPASPSVQVDEVEYTNGEIRYEKYWSEKMPYKAHWADRESQILARIRERKQNALHVAECVGIDLDLGLVTTRKAGEAIEILAAYAVEWGNSGNHIFSSAPEVLRLVRWSLVALQQIHDLGVVHADISAGNICIPIGSDCRNRLVLKYDQLRLIDFAFSMHKDIPLERPLPLDTERVDYMTGAWREAVRADQKSGHSQGKHAQKAMNPEQDLYSLGCMLEKIYTHFPLHEDASKIKANDIESLVSGLKTSGFIPIPTPRRISRLVKRVDGLLLASGLSIDKSTSFLIEAVNAPSGHKTADTPITPLAGNTGLNTNAQKAEGSTDTGSPVELLNEAEYNEILMTLKANRQDSLASRALTTHLNLLTEQALETCTTDDFDTLQTHLRKAYPSLASIPVVRESLARFACHVGELYLKAMSLAGDDVSRLGDVFGPTGIGVSLQIGDPGYLYILSLACRNGLAVSANNENAFYWSELAARENYPRAQYHLSWMYDDRYNHSRNKQDREASNFWLEQAAENGSKEAQVMLGSEYYIGGRFPADPEAAFFWMLQSAKQGEPNAQYQMGYFFLVGHGIEQDMEGAIDWFKKAAFNNNENAIKALNVINSEGPLRGKKAQLLAEEHKKNYWSDMEKNKSGSLKRTLEQWFSL